MLRFETANDSGYFLPDAIQPVSNGEGANQTVFRRPSENLRVRTDAIRSFLEKRTLLEQLYHHFVFVPESANARIYFDGSKFYVNSDGSSGTSTSGLILRVPFPNATLRYAMAKVWCGPEADRVSFILRSKKSVSEGGNNIKFKIVVDPGVSDVSLQITPSVDPDPEKGPVLVTAICPSGKCLGDLRDALNSPSHPFVGMPYVSNTNHEVVDIDEFYLSTVAIFGSEPDDTEITSIGSVGTTEILISASRLNAFFASNTLSDGDMVVVGFGTIDSLLDHNASAEVSLSKVSATNQVSSGILPAVSSTLVDDLLIPIAFVTGTGDNAILVFRDGQIFPKILSPYTKGPFLARKHDDAHIVASPKTGTRISLSEGTVSTQLEALRSAVDAAKIFVTVGTGGDYATLQAAFDAIKSVGGTIKLLDDITASTGVILNVASLEQTVHIDGNNKTINLSAGAMFMSGSVLPDGYVEITDLNIESAGPTATALVEVSDASFLRCNCSVISGTPVPLFSVIGRLRAENCYFYGNSVLAGVLAELNASGAWAIFNSCEIHNVGRAASVLNSAAGISFKDCYFNTVGFCDDTTRTNLVYVDSLCTLEQLYFDGCRIDLGYGNLFYFVGVVKYAHICGNFFGFQNNSGAAEYYFINLLNDGVSGYNATLKIIDNFVSLGSAYFINNAAYAHTEICGNIILGTGNGNNGALFSASGSFSTPRSVYITHNFVYPTNPYDHWVSGGSLITGLLYNKFFNVSVSVTAASKAFDVKDAVGNEIGVLGCPSNTYILAAEKACRNTLYKMSGGSALGGAIYTAFAWQNHISDFPSGIVLIGQQRVHVCNNYILMGTGGTNRYGIHGFAPSQNVYGVISNNFIQSGGTGSGTYCINLEDGADYKHYVAMVGNEVLYYSGQGAYTVGSNCGVGDPPDVASHNRAIQLS